MGAHLVTPDSAVRGRQIWKRYGGLQVLAGLDLDLKAGGFYALLGKNGSGKSTLMRILAHRETADGGELSVLGIPLNEDFANRGNDIGFVSEVNFLPGDCPLSEILRLNSQVFRNWNQATARRLVDGFSLDLGKKFFALSRGQQVQFGLVLALSYHPALILLDEVTSVLDASAREFLLQELRMRRQENATVVLSTNIVTEVLGHATDFILLGERRVKFAAKAEEIADSFVKLRKPKLVDHPIFLAHTSVEIGIEAGEAIFLVSKSDLGEIAVPAEFLSGEIITPNEIFIYLSRLRG